jgi:AHBA synthesis associated protein
MNFKDARLLILDLDYTLIDSSEGIVYCFNRARKQMGEPEVEPAKLIQRIGLPIEETFRHFGSQDPVQGRVIFRRIAAEGAMAQKSFLLPGAAETIAELHRRGFRLAVASTKSRREIIAVLEHLGLARYFEAFCGSDEVARAKPAPDSLFRVMEATGVKPEQTLYFGDHVVDIQAGRAAGVRVIALEGGPCSHADRVAAKPDAIVNDLRGVLALLA